jgi:enterochelin esterase family protein
MLERIYESSIISPAILKLRESIKIDRDKAVSEFWKKIEKLGTPIFEEIEGDDKYHIITFLVKEDGEVDNIICNNMFVIEDITEGLLERIEDTNIYFKSYKILKGVRDIYCLSKNNPPEPKDPSKNIFKHVDLIFHDPLNSKKSLFRVDKIKFPINEFESPEAPPQPYYGERTNIDKGKVEKFTSNSGMLDIERQILAYTPPNYSKDHIPYHFLILFDGILFEERAKISETLNNLIADDKIPPLVAIMVENFIPTNVALRSTELVPNPKFMGYIIDELLPLVRKKYNITSDPNHSVIAGASLGSLAASFIAFKNPEIFSNVLSMSGAYGWYPGADYWIQRVNNIKDLERWWSEEDEKEEEWLIRRYAQSKKLPLKFYLDVGVLEENDPNQLFNSNRHFRNVLKTKGYPISYVEFLGGHDFVCWRGSIADGLIYLIGK